MAYMRYEERYLLALVAAMINQTKSPQPARRIDWNTVFRLADYHQVANVAYYGLLGIDGIQQNWQARFYKRYLEYVNHINPLEQAELLVKEMMELYEVPAVVLAGAYGRDLYPVREMSCVERIDVLAQPGARQKLRKALEELDFEWRPGGDSESSLYYRVPGVSLCIREELSFTGKEMKRYFENCLEALPLLGDYGYVRTLTPNVGYIYLICRLTERYAAGEIEIRDLMDLWLYTKKNKEKLDFDLIARETEKLLPPVFFSHITTLADIWFGKGQMPPDELDTYEAMESYILTKGEDGQEVSRRMLPLIKKVADNYQRNRKKERFMKQLRWLFPDFEYMVELYPMLEDAEILLPACWLYRLLRMAFQYMFHCIKAFTALAGGILKEQIQKLSGQAKQIRGKISAAIAACKEKVRKNL